MSTIAIELNDAGVLVAGEEGLVDAGPGYALLDPKGMLTGSEAYQRARLKPTLINNRFWDQLSTEQLSKPGPNARTYADLAFAHLQDIWKQIGEAGSVIFAVPSNWTTHQLGLLLGIAQACSVPAVGMVDSAVAATRVQAPGRALLHLDIQLHRSVLTHLSQDDELSKSQVVVAPGMGMVAVREAWVGLIASAFVRMTRFDPLHLADSEQQLYDLLPEWIRQLEAEDTLELEMDFADKVHATSVKREQFVQAAGGVYQRLVEQVTAQRRGGEPLTIVLSHRLGELIGLPELLEQLPDCEVLTLKSGAAAWGALGQESVIRSGDQEALDFVTKLPLDGGERPTASPRRVSAARGDKPTHILHESLAYEIVQEPFVVGANIGEERKGITLAGPTHGISRSHFSVFARGDHVFLKDHSTYGTYVNDERVNEQTTLRVGDKIRVGSPGQELRLIATRGGESRGT